MNNLKKQFQGDLNEEDSISLAKSLFKFGHDKRAEYPQCDKVKSFYICEDTKDGKNWLPILKLAFNWTKDIDKAFTYIVNFAKSPQEYLNDLVAWEVARKEKSDKKLP